MPMSHLELAFWKFHSENPTIYLLFDKFAREILAAGYRRYSSDAVLHRIRWHTHIVNRNPKLHFSNNHSPYYARLWMQQYPQHAGLFELRTVTEARDPIPDTPPDDPDGNPDDGPDRPISPDEEPAGPDLSDIPASPAGEGHARRPAASSETHLTA